MKKLFFVGLFCLTAGIASGQQSVAITIDDVPNIQLFESNHPTSLLQEKLDSLHIPIAIFINEGNLGQPQAAEKSIKLLKSWLSRDYITAGNHGFVHKNYGEAGFEAFQEDVNKGEKHTGSLVKGLGKELKYFRFPFNSLGNDSLEQVKAQKYLGTKGYISTPFTVESEDWLFAILYDKALAEHNVSHAAEIGEKYLAYTRNLFSYLDSLSVKQYGRSVRQIYLCHDNRLNAHYLAKIVGQLKQDGYKLISLDEAMNDPLYQLPSYYFGKEGFSWLYRWIKDPKERMKWMKGEPSNAVIQKEFEEMNRKK
jgi:hypothetical protein